MGVNLAAMWRRCFSQQQEECCKARLIVCFSENNLQITFKKMTLLVLIKNY